MRQILIIISVLLAGCSNYVSYRVSDTVMLDTGANRTAIDYMPEGSKVLYYIDVYTADGVSKRPVIQYELDYVGCKATLEVSVREPSPYMSSVLLGRDFIKKCDLAVTVR